MQTSRLLGILILIIYLAGCANRPYNKSNQQYRKKLKAYTREIRKVPDNKHTANTIQSTSEWVGAVNFNLRKPNFVILHHTAQNSCEKTLKTFTTEKSQVSAHYVICKDGKLVQMLNDYLRGWHAGAARWGNITDINSVSIGIELDNNGFEEFSELQLNSLLNLLAILKKKYNIPISNFIGHADIAPARKTDPSVYFPWKRLAEHGFGLWYSDTSALELPVDFNPAMALKIIGYDLSDEAQSIQAFRRHFLQSAKEGLLTFEEKKVLYMLQKQLM